VEDEGEIVETELLVDAGEQAGIQNRQVDDIAALQRRDDLQVAAELAAREESDLDLAAAPFGDEVGKFLGALLLRMTDIVDEGEAQRAVLDLGLRDTEQHDRTGEKAACNCAEAFHEIPPWLTLLARRTSAGGFQRRYPPPMNHRAGTRTS